MARRDDIWSATGQNISTAYRHLRDRQFRIDGELHAHIDGLWSKYRGLAERSFIQGFAHDPDARLWEMALACHFLDLEKDILPGAQKDIGGPDICLGLGDGCGHVWIEAVCPQNAVSDADRIPLEQGDGWKPVREVQLRLLSALQNKRRVCSGYVSNAESPVRPEDPVVIALSTGRFGPLGGLDAVPDFAGCVLPIDGEYYQGDAETGKFEGPRLKFGKSVVKASLNAVDGVEIDRAMFLSDEFRGIAGVIFSNFGLYCGMERPRLVFFHNPNASAPLPRKWAEWDQEYVIHIRDDGFFRLERLD